MKLFSVVITLLVLSGCTFYNVKPFAEPQAGAIAYISGNGALKGLFLTGRKTHLTVYKGCEIETNAKPDRSDIVFQESEFNSKVAKIPAGIRTYFSYGTVDDNWDCRVAFSFIPEEFVKYKVDYKMDFGGCKVSVAAESDVEIPSLQTYENQFINAWARCSPFY